VEKGSVGGILCQSPAGHAQMNGDIFLELLHSFYTITI